MACPVKARIWATSVYRRPVLSIKTKATNFSRCLMDGPNKQPVKHPPTGIGETGRTWSPGRLDPNLFSRKHVYLRANEKNLWKIYQSSPLSPKQGRLSHADNVRKKRQVTVTHRTHLVAPIGAFAAIAANPRGLHLHLHFGRWMRSTGSNYMGLDAQTCTCKIVIALSVCRGASKFTYV